MTHHPACYGAMFPDLTQLEHNIPCKGKVFTVVVRTSGIGNQGDVVETDYAAWEDCQRCLSYTSCYDLCMAKIALGNALYSQTGTTVTRDISVNVD